MINFPYTLDQVPVEQYAAMNTYIETELNGQLLTIAQVNETYKISTQMQYLMIKENRIPGAIMVGKTRLYLMQLAKPFFEQYVVKQQAKASVKEAKKTEPAKKRGRGKKAKTEYTYTLFGQEHTDSRPLRTVQQEWFVKLAQSFPHYYVDVENAKVHPDVMNNPDAYPQYYTDVLPWRVQINDTFNKLVAEKG